MRDTIQRWCREDEGVTLVELIVVMAIFTGLLTIVFSILITVSYQTSDNLARTRQIEQVRLGLMQIDRQVRSGNVIEDPLEESFADSGVEPGYSLRVYTQADGVFQCAQWRVIFEDGKDQGRLEYRSWDPAWRSTGLVEDWHAVAHGVVDQAKTDALVEPPFVRLDKGDSEEDGKARAQSVRVTLWVKDRQSRQDSKASAVSSVLTGRNTIFGYLQNQCDDVPEP